MRKCAILEVVSEMKAPRQNADTGASSLPSGNGIPTPVYIFLAVCVLVFVLLVVVAMIDAKWEHASLWVRQFILKNGAGIATGFGAIVAAIIAFLGISHQVKVSRAALDHAEKNSAKTLSHSRKTLRQTKRSDERANWWRTFEWAAERVAPAHAEELSLPRYVILETLDVLERTAPTEAQKKACGSVFNHVTGLLQNTPTGVGARESGGGESGAASDALLDRPSSSEQEAALGVLKRYVDRTKGTSSASPAASEMLSRLEFTNSITEAARADGYEVTMITKGPVEYLSGSGALSVKKNGCEDVIVMFLDEVDMKTIADNALSFSATAGAEKRWLLVSRPVLGTPNGANLYGYTFSARWADDADTPGVMEALAKAGTPSVE